MLENFMHLIIHFEICLCSLLKCEEPQSVPLLLKQNRPGCDKRSNYELIQCLLCCHIELLTPRTQGN